MWRLRDGLAAISQGNVGNGATLQALSDAMTAPRARHRLCLHHGAVAGSRRSPRRSPRSSPPARAAATRTGLPQRAAGHACRAGGSATGVDTDVELQSLTLVEQAYAANAKVLSVIDQLMQLLLEN